jgi:hypothetical protein
MDTRFISACKKDQCDYCGGVINVNDYIYWNPRTRLAYHQDCITLAEIGK